MSREDEGKGSRIHKSDFPCPNCGGNNTMNIQPSKKISTRENEQDWPIIYGSDTMPNYMRERKCYDCGCEWKTCESVVIHSVKSKNGLVIG